MLLLTFALEGRVRVQKLVDLGSNPVLQKGHSLVGSGFPPKVTLAGRVGSGLSEVGRRLMRGTRL